MTRILVLAALSIVALSAHAQPYIGASVSGIRSDSDAVGAGPDSHSFPSLALGYRVSKYLSIEGATFRPDSLLQRAFTVALAPDTTRLVNRVWNDANGYRLSVLGTLPITENLSILGRASAYRIKAHFALSDITTQCPTPTTCVNLAQSSESVNASETLPALGIGAEYEMIPELRVRLIHERIKPKAGMFGAGNDLERISTTSLEVLYQF